MRRLALLVAPLAGIATAGLLAAQGKLTLDLGIGRRVRPLGPQRRRIAAPPPTVFEVIAGPYRRTPRAMAARLRVWERGEETFVAQHITRSGALETSTVESVRLEAPHRVSFRVLRGPVPHVRETYELREAGGGTDFTYSGELGTDLWALGSWWGGRVAAAWESAVAESLDAIQAESERLAGRGGAA